MPIMMSSIARFVALAAMAASPLVAAVPAAADDEPSWYAFSLSGAHPLVLDAPKDPDDPLRVMPYDKNVPNQAWFLEERGHDVVRFHSQASDWCVIALGDQVEMRDCLEEGPQFWHMRGNLRGTVEFSPALGGEGKCMAVDGGKVVVRRCDSSAPHRWEAFVAHS